MADLAVVVHHRRTGNDDGVFLEVAELEGLLAVGPGQLDDAVHGAAIVSASVTLGLGVVGEVHAGDVVAVDAIKLSHVLGMAGMRGSVEIASSAGAPLGVSAHVSLEVAHGCLEHAVALKALPLVAVLQLLVLGVGGHGNDLLHHEGGVEVIHPGVSVLGGAGREVQHLALGGGDGGQVEEVVARNVSLGGTVVHGTKDDVAKAEVAVLQGLAAGQVGLVGDLLALVHEVSHVQDAVQAGLLHVDGVAIAIVRGHLVKILLAGVLGHEVQLVHEHVREGQGQLRGLVIEQGQRAVDPAGAKGPLHSIAVVLSAVVAVTANLADELAAVLAHGHVVVHLVTIIKRGLQLVGDRGSSPRLRGEAVVLHPTQENEGVVLRLGITLLVAAIDALAGLQAEASIHSELRLLQELPSLAHNRGRGVNDLVLFRGTNDILNALEASHAVGVTDGQHIIVGASVDGILATVLHQGSRDAVSLGLAHVVLDVLSSQLRANGGGSGPVQGSHQAGHLGASTGATTTLHKGTLANNGGGLNEGISANDGVKDAVQGVLGALAGLTKAGASVADLHHVHANGEGELLMGQELVVSGLLEVVGHKVLRVLAASGKHKLGGGFTGIADFHVAIQGYYNVSTGKDVKAFSLKFSKTRNCKNFFILFYLVTHILHLLQTTSLFFYRASAASLRFP